MQFFSAEDVLNYAIKQEEASSDYYESATDFIKDADVKRIFKTLATEEQKHIKYLTDFELGKNTAFESLVYKINQYQAPPEDIIFKQSFSKKEVLDFAISMEKQSEYLYSSLAKATKKNDKLLKLFLTLATIENQHIEKLAGLQDHPFFKS